MNGKKTYFVKNTEDGVFQDVTTLFDGLAVLKVDGLLAQGKPVNIYTAQWINSQKEDFLITTTDEYGWPVVIRENVDIDITFCIRKKYAKGTIDVSEVHDAFKRYMTSKDVWVKSAYASGKIAHCVCLKEYKPTSYKLQRGDDDYILGTITLHCIDDIK